MKTKTLYGYIAWLALAAAVMMAAMLAVAFAHEGTTAQDFEAFTNPETYSSTLLAFEGSLRAILTFDNFFVLFYTGAFVLLAMALKDKENGWLLAVGLGALVLTSFLDLNENNDLLVFLQMGHAGSAPTAEMLHARALWSAIKFHSSYLSFFLFAFVLPQKTWLEKFLRWSLWLGYVPIGILTYTYPNGWLSLARYAFMLSGLLILGWNAYLRSKK